MRSAFRNSGVIAIAIAMIICAALGIYGWMSIQRVDTSQFLYVFGTLVAPNLALLWNNYKTSQIRGDVVGMKDKVELIEHNTNGTLTALTEHIPEIVDKVETLVERVEPPAGTAPTAGAPTTPHPPRP